ncbi:MAG TPA: hypothetical protein VM328_07775 [Fimbriimonadaceae bacterium]|nr:hypothetical protein [Fimbriimonadaceae bacterium]
MRTVRLVFVGGILLWFLGACQQTLPHRLSIFGARPDFLLILATTLSLLTSRAGGGIVGFFSGLAHGAIAGANLTHYVISRALSSFAVSWVRALSSEPSALGVALYALFHTLAAQLLLMFLIAPQNLAQFLGDTMGTALYNGVLAIPLYALLKRVVGKRER